MFLNRCQNCVSGTNMFCVYADVTVVKNDKKEFLEVPAEGCKKGSSDVYSIYPDVEELDTHTSVLYKWRTCEYTDPDDIDNMFNANKHNWEMTGSSSSTGDGYILGNRYDYDHPMFHMQDYCSPINTSDNILNDENCYLTMGNSPALISKSWNEDVNGWHKKPIGVPRVSYCNDLKGYYDKNLDMVIHPSMKDWQNKILTYKNYTTISFNNYYKPEFNIFSSNEKEVEEYLSKNIADKKALVNIINGYKLVRMGKNLNIKLLFTNNGVNQNISYNISIKNPESIYKAKSGYRYNLKLVSELYFNIVNDVIFNITKYGHTQEKEVNRNQAKKMKHKFLASIINYLLNDPKLESYANITSTKKQNEYKEWYESVKDTLDKDFLYSLHPSNININEKINSNFHYFIKVILHAIKVQKILKVEMIPENIKSVIKVYMKNKKEIGLEEDKNPPTISVEQLLKDEEVYVEETFLHFKKLMKHCTYLTRKSVLEMFLKLDYAIINNNPKDFYDYIQYEADGSTSLLQYINEEDFEVSSVTSETIFENCTYYKGLEDVEDDQQEDEDVKDNFFDNNEEEN